MILNCQDQLDSVQSMTKTKQDNDMTNCISPLNTENETQLFCLIRQCMVNDKERWDNDMTDRTDIVYIKIKTELS